MLKYTAALLILFTTTTLCQKDDVIRIFKKCSKSSPDFDLCLKGAFNESIAYYKTGIPELGIAPFDPHRLELLEDRRKNAIYSYSLIATDIAEYGWTNSRITKFKTQPENNRFVYTQTFPYKHLNGNYDFKLNTFGETVRSKGYWNITLHDYTQTTTVSRIGGPGSPINVRLVIDNIEKVEVYCSDQPADVMFKMIMSIGFPIAKPQMEDMISKAFTIIFNRSFGTLDLNDFLSE